MEIAKYFSWDDPSYRWRNEMSEMSERRNKMSEKQLDSAHSTELNAGFKAVGNPDAWHLLGKVSNTGEGWMKSTKAMNVPSGVVIQVSTQIESNPAEAITFIPGVMAVPDENYPKAHKLVPIGAG